MRERFGKGVPSDGTAIAFDRLGESPSVIVVRGAMCHRALMRPTIERLVRRFATFKNGLRGRGDRGDTVLCAVERDV